MDLIDRSALEAENVEQPREDLRSSPATTTPTRVFFLHWVREKFRGAEGGKSYAKRSWRLWGGNGVGRRTSPISTISAMDRAPRHLSGPHYAISAMSRSGRSPRLWTGDVSDPIMAQPASSKPRPVKGRCGRCASIKSVCNGNTRVRAHAAHRRPLGRGPRLLFDRRRRSASMAEANASRSSALLVNRPFRGKSHDPVPKLPA